MLSKKNHHFKNMQTALVIQVYRKRRRNKKLRNHQITKSIEEYPLNRHPH